MTQVHINEPEALCLPLFRMALSESDHEARLNAIDVARHEIVNAGLANFPLGSKNKASRTFDPEFVHWVAETSVERTEAAHQMAEIGQRFERKNYHHLNVAEYIGKWVWMSIQERKYQGMHVRGGLLEQVRDAARNLGKRGARDKDVLRKIWNTYRGVVHLGMAMDFCEDNGESETEILHRAETIRRVLSETCPKGTTQPYVDPSEQISFLYITDI